MLIHKNEALKIGAYQCHVGRDHVYLTFIGNVSFLALHYHVFVSMSRDRTLHVTSLKQTSLGKSWCVFTIFLSKRKRLKSKVSVLGMCVSM